MQREPKPVLLSAMHKMEEQKVRYEDSKRAMATEVDKCVLQHVNEARARQETQSTFKYIQNIAYGVYSLTLAGLFEPRKYRLAHHALRLAMQQEQQERDRAATHVDQIPID